MSEGKTPKMFGSWPALFEVFDGNGGILQVECTRPTALGGKRDGGQGGSCQFNHLNAAGEFHQMPGRMLAFTNTPRSVGLECVPEAGEGRLRMVLEKKKSIWPHPRVSTGIGMVSMMTGSWTAQFTGPASFWKKAAQSWRCPFSTRIIEGHFLGPEGFFHLQGKLGPTKNYSRADLRSQSLSSDGTSNLLQKGRLHFENGPAHSGELGTYRIIRDGKIVAEIRAGKLLRYTQTESGETEHQHLLQGTLMRKGQSPVPGMLRVGFPHLQDKKAH
jgi:hypothetical protein